MRYALVLLAACATTPRPVPPVPDDGALDTVSTHARTVIDLGHGVHVIRHPDAPDTFPQGNTTVIIGTSAVLVVDACYLPSAAVEDIADIRRWTRLPVRYLVNTHWHYDHTMGNGAYRDAFPGLEIIAQRETREQIAGYDPQWFASFPGRAQKFRAAIDSGHDASGRELSPGEIAEYEAALAGLEPVWKEFEPLAARHDLVPDRVFDDHLTIELGGRRVDLLHLGRGNTAGDAVAWLPDMGLLVAGDLVDHPVPYLGSGYPVDEIATLERLLALHPARLVPGHGRVLGGTAYVELLVAFLREVVARVDAALDQVGSGASKLEQVKALVRPQLEGWSERFCPAADAECRDFFLGFSLDGVITATYAQLWPR